MLVARGVDVDIAARTYVGNAGYCSSASRPSLSSLASRRPIRDGRTSRIGRCGVLLPPGKPAPAAVGSVAAPDTSCRPEASPLSAACVGHRRWPRFNFLFEEARLFGAGDAQRTLAEERSTEAGRETHQELSRPQRCWPMVLDSVHHGNLPHTETVLVPAKRRRAHDVSL